MPRGTKRSTARSDTVGQSKEVAVVEPHGDLLPPEEPKKPLFPLVVGSFDGLLPGQEGYEVEKDRMAIGFVFGNSTIPMWMDKAKVKLDEVSAYDFLTNPSTGYREGQTIPPHSVTKTDLSNGFTTWTDLPPLHIWRGGMYLADAIWEPAFKDEDFPVYLNTMIDKAIIDWQGDRTKTPIELFPYWLTSGEGTTGNNLYRLWLLPDEIAKKPDPPHPKMWRKELQEKKYPLAGLGYGGGGTKPSITPTVKAPSIPAGVRYRCPGCGHWYAQGDLPGHAQVCGKGEDADWAMMCHSDCGCRNLDEACKPKAGFPRPKPEPKVEEPVEKPAVEATPTGS